MGPCSAIIYAVLVIIVSLGFYQNYKINRALLKQRKISEDIQSVTNCYTEAVGIRDTIEEIENALESFENQAYEHRSILNDIKNELEAYSTKLNNDFEVHDFEKFEEFMTSVNKKLDDLKTRFNYDFWDYKAAFVVKCIPKLLQIQKLQFQRLSSECLTLQKHIRDLEFYRVIQQDPIEKDEPLSNFISEFNFTEGLTPYEAEILDILIEKRRMNYDRPIRFCYTDLSKSNKFRLAKLEILITQLKEDEPLLLFFQRIFSTIHSNLLHTMDGVDIKLKETMVESMNDILDSHKEFFDIVLNMEIFNVELESSK